MLSDEGLPLIEIPQSVERMTGVLGSLLEVIKRGELAHDGDVLLRQHVLNAVPRFNDRGFTLQKSKSRGRIDGAIALGLAVDDDVHVVLAEQVHVLRAVLADLAEAELRERAHRRRAGDASRAPAERAPES